MHFTIPYASKMLPRAKLFFITPTQFCKPITPPSCHFRNSAREDTDCVNILQDACLVHFFFLVNQFIFLLVPGNHHSLHILLYLRIYTGSSSFNLNSFQT